MAGNVGYVRYFTAFVYEFQFYRTLCLISKQYDPADPLKVRKFQKKIVMSSILKKKTPQLFSLISA